MIYCGVSALDMLDSSPYLAALRERHPGLDIMGGLSAMHGILRRMRAHHVRHHGPDDACAFLRLQKQHFVLLWAVAELGDALPYNRLGRLLCQFAEAAIDYSLINSWRQPDLAHACRVDSHDQILPGLFVLGLGKLGGLDLNFSSDIDLIAFYDQDSLAIPRECGQSETCNRILKAMNHRLHENRDDGFVWRTDWQLRPEASSRPLAISTDAARDFYHHRAAPWHRLALLKARVVAGDRAAGQRFLDSMAPFIWHRDLDYRFYDELRRLKKRIDLAHPSLVRQRHQVRHIDKSAAGFNLKLGWGGIREIEFIINAMQLVWGGRKPALRATGSLRSLRLLVRHGLMGAGLGDELANGYRFLRRLENRLQMLDNQQTHKLPDAEGGQQALMGILGLPDWAHLESRLLPVRQLVSEHFDKLFEEPTVPSAPKAQDMHWSAALDEEAQSIVASWRRGFDCYGLRDAGDTSELCRHLLACIERHAGGQPQASGEAVRQVHDFFQKLSSAQQYFRLLLFHSHAIEAVVVPLLASPHMATLLRQSPHIIDRLLDPARDRRRHYDRRMIPAWRSGHGEAGQSTLRRIINEQLYHLYWRLLRGRSDCRALSNHLTALAEAALDAGVRMACKAEGLRSAPLGVLGLGALGRRAMAPMSDLDLVFIVPHIDQLHDANSFARTLHNLMERQLDEGVAWRMDTRLRPSGRAGSPVVSLERFVNHHRTQARTWEHLALACARHICGHPIAERAAQLRAELLARPRDMRQFINDSHQMLRRLRAERLESEPTLDIKHRLGGLVETDYLISCLCVQYSNPQNPDAMPELAAMERPQAVAQLGKIPAFAQLPLINDFWQNLLPWVRLLDLGRRGLAPVPAHLHPIICRSLHLHSLDELPERISTHSTTTQKYLDHLMRDSDLHPKAAMQSWQERPVQWTNQK